MPEYIWHLLQKIRWGLILAAIVTLLFLDIPRLALILATSALLLRVMGQVPWFQRILIKLFEDKDAG